MEKYRVTFKKSYHAFDFVFNEWNEATHFMYTCLKSIEADGDSVYVMLSIDKEEPDEEESRDIPL